MSKTLRMSFTGNAVLTPAYPDDLQPRNGPLTAIMPGARRRRKALFDHQQINAQFAFLQFDYPQLVVEALNDRDADYIYPSEEDKQQGLCFLEREQVFLQVEDGPLTFRDGDVTAYPTVDSHETKYIARWDDFALGNAKLKPGVLERFDDYVRVVIPHGEITAGFVAEPIARIEFDYGPVTPVALPYAQEIVVTIEFEDAVTEVTLRCDPFPPFMENEESSFLTFTWGGRPSIDLLFGNGSLASIYSVLTGPIAGHDHLGDYDDEFNVLYDIVDCKEDDDGRQPLPHIKSSEVLRIPCISSMIGDGTTVTGMAKAKAAVRGQAQAAPFLPRTSRLERRQRRTK